MTTQVPSMEELRARVKALDSPLAPPEIVHSDLESPHELTHKEDKSPSMWRALLQLRVLLPYISRLVPMLDGTGQQSTAQASELHKGLVDVQSGHQELRTHLQEEAVQMKRIEEELLRLREATERNTSEQQELIEDLKSFAGVIKTVAIAGSILLLANAGLLVYLVVRQAR